MAIKDEIQSTIDANDVVLFMKGTPDFPQCGFSGQVIQILNHMDVSYKPVNCKAPIRAGLAPVRLGANLARKLNRAAEEQKLFGERRLAHVGVGNNRKGPPPGDRILMVHADASLQGEASVSIGRRWLTLSLHLARFASAALRETTNT